ncbi:MAG: sigma-70 family RNA polymerase sigma factor [Bacteroidota bacterium]
MRPISKKNKPSEQAFRQCYEDVFQRIHDFFCHRTRDRETAKDLVHDFFLKLFANWERYSSASAPDAYLFALARNLLIDHYRKSLNAELATDPATMELPEQGSDVNHLREDKMDAIHQAIAQLPVQRQQIFKMKKLQGLTSEEVADQLGLSKRTVENQVYRAMNALRKQLAGLFSSFF